MGVLSIPHSSHLCLGCSAKVCLVLVQCTHLGFWPQLRFRYELLAVEATVSPRFDKTDNVVVTLSMQECS